MSSPKKVGRRRAESFGIALLVFLCGLSGMAFAAPGGRERPLRVMVWSWSPEVDRALDRTIDEFQEANGVRVELVRMQPAKSSGRGSDDLKERALQRLTEALGGLNPGSAAPATAMPPAGYRDELTARFDRGEGPDVVWIQEEMVAPFAGAGWLAALDPLAQRLAVSENLPPRAMQRFRHQDHYYGIPLGSTGGLALTAFAVSTTANAELAYELIPMLRARLQPAPPAAGPRPSGDGEFLILEIDSTLTDAARSRIDDPSVLADIQLYLSVHSLRLTLGKSMTRVDSFDGSGQALFTIVLGTRDRATRSGMLINHRRKTILRLPAPETLPAVPSWIMEAEEPGVMTVYLGNGCLLRAEGSSGAPLRPHEAHGLWHDVLWIERQDTSGAPPWQTLGAMGVPRLIELIDPASAQVLTRLEIRSARRSGSAPSLDTEGYRVDESRRGPLAGIEQAREAAPTPGTLPEATLLTGTTGGGEHIGWLISPELPKELAQIFNKVFSAAGSFKEIDPADGSLIIDWYARAGKVLGANKKNEFTILREFLKSLIAMYIIPTELEKGQIPAEMKVPFEMWLKQIIGDKKIPPADRWCAFIKALKKRKPDLGGKEPTPREHAAYRNKVLLDLVEKVLVSRYGVFKIPMPSSIPFNCWAFDFEARDFKFKILPAYKTLKNFRVTKKGLHLDLEIDRVEADLDYDLTPGGSTGNVALCIFTAGVANLVEMDSGSGKVTAKHVVLSLDFVPKRKGNQIRFEVSQADSSHATLEYAFYGTNILTYGKMEILSTIFTLANAFESDLLDVLDDQVTDVLRDLLFVFPELFSFSDTPPTLLAKEVIGATPGKALLLGASLQLPKERYPSPPPPLTTPACEGDFAVSLATDYLNAVLYSRLEKHQKSTTPLSFDWKTYTSLEDLPSVGLPSDYNEPGASSNFPKDFEKNDEVWTVTDPYLELGNLSSPPGLEDPVGTIHFTVGYRLTRTHYGLWGRVRLPEIDPDVWWLDQWGPGPVVRGGSVYVDLEHFMSVRYGAYRQADGRIVSQYPAFLKLRHVKVNPSQAAHSLDVGGIVVTWSPYAVATDEHINVQIDVSAPAHITLTGRLSFLPELDLSYGQQSVKVKKFQVSSALGGLQGKEAMFQKMIGDHFRSFFRRHKFSKKFDHRYINMIMLCKDLYSPYRPGEKPILLYYDVFSMKSRSDPKKLWIKRDGRKLRVNFDFLKGML